MQVLSNVAILSTEAFSVGLRGSRALIRKINVDTSKQDICRILFARKRAQRACRLFLAELKRHNGLTRAELSRFADNLNAGKVQPGFKYSRRQFYATVRQTLLNVGLVAVEQRFVWQAEQDLAPERKHRRDTVEKYVAVRQPIPKRPPDGVNLPRLMWIVCKRWNDEFME
jgi:hypothetical protein